MAYNTNSFIEKANQVHNNRYTYNNTQYTNSRNKVVITCPIHGDFEQIAAEHIRGKGCPYCGGTKKSNTKEFIEKAKNVHGDKYNYDKVVYKNNYTKVVIICPIHGEFEQTPNNHLNGQDCPLCSNIDNPNIKLNTQEFVEKAQRIHNSKYDYSKVDYINSHTKVCIICPEHGEFWQRPENHIIQQQGCPICQQSHGERLIKTLLDSKNIKYIPQYSIKVPKDIRKSEEAFVDFYLPDLNIIIEYNGVQHYKYIPYLHKGNVLNFKSQVNRDNYVKEYCKNNNIKLIEISFQQNDEEILNIINNLKS